MDKSLTVILERLSILEKRISRLENHPPASQATPDQYDGQKSEDLISHHVAQHPANQNPVASDRYPEPLPDRDKPTNENEPRSGSFLGLVGAACIFFASVILVKFSIDSGWLTPVRQCILSAIVGLMMILIPLTQLFNDRKYLSILPAVGVGVLHFTIYACVFYHHILSVQLGLVMVSAVGLLSIALLQHFKDDVYAVLASFGTYLGALIMHDAFSHWLYLSSFVVAWALAFASFAIVLKNRAIIVVVSYLGLGFVSLYVMKSGGETISPPLFKAAILTQLLQFLIFCLALVVYAVRHRTTLSKEEAWKFFPVVLFFYGQEYYYINAIAPHLTLVCVGGFAAFIYGVYAWSKFKAAAETLHSGGVVYTLISFMFMHAVYFALLNEVEQIVLTFVMALGLGWFRKPFFQFPHYKGPLVIATIIFLYSYGLVLFADAPNLHVSKSTWAVFGGSFAGMILLAFLFAKKSIFLNIALYLGHLQAYIAIYRMKEMWSAFAIAPLWIMYAFVILYVAYLKKNYFLATSAVPLIVIAILRFMVSDFSTLGVGERVVSLFIMGGLIYAGGYFYRKIPRSV